MNKYLHYILYYISLLLGLSMTSWMIWSRFIRERTIRDIPDGLFTEYRFWILLYICAIYIYVVKNLIWPKKGNEFLGYLSELFFTPLKTLDHFIKYNIYTKAYYYKVMESFIKKLDNVSKIQFLLVYYIFQIIPRCILVLFLVTDTFYFNTLELLYKVILIGILPMVLRYINYSIKDLYNHWVETLENTYNYIDIDEKGYENVYRSTEDHTLAEYHKQEVSIKEYIEIKYFNMLEHECEENFPYEYVGTAYAKNHIYKDYRIKKYKLDTVKLTWADYKEIDKPFLELMPKILDLKTTLFGIDGTKQDITIKWSKVVIFSLYVICWSFILIISYYVYPVKFPMFKYLCKNLVRYLTIQDDPFSLLDGYSVNKNYLTIEKLKLIYKKILDKLFNG